MLKNLFSSSIRADVLSLLLNSPDEKFYVREIARLLRKNPSGIKRELDNLEEMDVVVSERVANLRYFHANKNSPLFSELKNLVTKSLGLPGAIKALVRASGAKAAFIYGPYADGTREDKVDIMVIGPGSSLVNGFRDIEKKFSCSITWIEMDQDEYRDKRRREDSRLIGILSKKRIPLIGRV